MEQANASEEKASTGVSKTRPGRSVCPTPPSEVYTCPPHTLPGAHGIHGRRNEQLWQTMAVPAVPSTLHPEGCSSSTLGHLSLPFAAHLPAAGKVGAICLHMLIPSPAQRGPELVEQARGHRHLLL